MKRLKLLWRGMQDPETGVLLEERGRSAIECHVEATVCSLLDIVDGIFYRVAGDSMPC